LINTEQHRLIEEKAYAFDHNYAYYSLISGEPFLYDNSLFYYFDGKKLSIHLIELDKGHSRKDLKTIVFELYSQYDPEIIVVWGPDPLERVPHPPGWSCRVLAESGPYTRDMSLHLDSFDPQKVPNLSEAHLYARTNGIEIRAVPQTQMTAEHILLLRRMVNRNKPDIFDRIFYATMASWIPYSNHILFDVLLNEKLMGFVVLDLTIRTLPMMIIGAYEHRPAVFSDLLYDAVIRHCCEKGYDRLVFGHSYGKGLFEYKQKWGECEVQPGVWEIMLNRPGSKLDTNTHPWLARNLGKQRFRTISW
jgi:hypothetical protein